MCKRSCAAYYLLSTVLSLYIYFSQQSHEVDNIHHISEETKYREVVSCPEGGASKWQAVI